MQKRGILLALFLILNFSLVSSADFGYNILDPPEEPRIIIGNLTQNITIININQTNNITGNPFDQDLNTTDVVTFANVTSTGWFFGLFNWVINLFDGSDAYLSFNSTTLSFNEAKLNSTISEIANLSSGVGTGNPFDQDLNTTNNVTFQKVTFGNGVSNSSIYIDQTTGDTIFT